MLSNPFGKLNVMVCLDVKGQTNMWKSTRLNSERMPIPKVCMQMWQRLADLDNMFPNISTISGHFDSFPGEKFIVKWFSNSALQCSALEPDLSLSLDDQHFTNSTLSHIAVK